MHLFKSGKGGPRLLRVVNGYDKEVGTEGGLITNREPVNCVEGCMRSTLPENIPAMVTLLSCRKKQARIISAHDHDIFFIPLFRRTTHTHTIRFPTIFTINSQFSLKPRQRPSIQ